MRLKIEAADAERSKAGIGKRDRRGQTRRAGTRNDNVSGRRWRTQADL
jgi:hypothetical protein